MTAYTMDSFDNPGLRKHMPFLCQIGAIDEEWKPQETATIKRSNIDPESWIVEWTENGLPYGMLFGVTESPVFDYPDKGNIDPVDILTSLNEMTNDERIEIFSHFCGHCGCKNPSCGCA